MGGDYAAGGQMVMPFYVLCDVSQALTGNIAAFSDGIARLRRLVRLMGTALLRNVTWPKPLYADVRGQWRANRPRPNVAAVSQSHASQCVVARVDSMG